MICCCVLRAFVAVIVMVVGIAGCRNVRSSGVPTGGGYRPNAGPVTIRASDVPPGAVQVGVAQAFGQATIDQLVPEFADRVAKLGGNFGKIDDIRTKFEMQSKSESYQYSCGTPQAPRQCTGTRTRTVEVATTTIIGRAFRVENLPR